MKVKIKKLHEQAKMPFKKHSADAGFDLYATSRVNEGGNIVYGTGLAFEIPEGFVGLVFPRSSIANKTIALSNAVGVIDASYRGEVTFKFKPTLTIASNKNFAGIEVGCIINGSYNIGERIGQLIIMPIPSVQFEFTEELTSTARGAGGYGSTGTK
ncbi:MAG TPA: hypothetical protein VK050_06430 [Flavobacteriaceae bacterium]|nr:hypothetical protein [Flavobacteriaceae bacterium]